MACDLAQESADAGGFPCGSIVVSNNIVIGEGMSLSKTRIDPTNHAEIMAIQAAARYQKSAELNRASLYSSLEPCLMCLHAAHWAGIDRIIYGAQKININSKYYEGKLTLTAANSAMSKVIDVCYLPNFEVSMVRLIDKYQQQSG